MVIMNVLVCLIEGFLNYVPRNDSREVIFKCIRVFL